MRGYGHRIHGVPRQDEVAVLAHAHTNAVAFAVADGVSAAAESHVGAMLACRTAVDDIIRQLDAGADGIDLRTSVNSAAWQLVMRVTGGTDPDAGAREAAERRFATTLITGLAVPTDEGSLSVSLLRVGDSRAWVLREQEYTRVFTERELRADEPDAGEVIALPRVPRDLEPVLVTVPRDGVLLVGTDGFMDALGDGTGEIGRTFGCHLSTPPPPIRLGHLLDFSWEPFDDDRSLLALWPRVE
ncbi:protein phosphatase 2C domain-containing protein [Streptomyces phaeochromogenes]|uniref:protein phosphatase 2C domain-containing protein n=1 Tax=Streptomyces phaeochromogenes TaxID=1923 RepID=UPI0033F5B811